MVYNTDNGHVHYEPKSIFCCALPDAVAHRSIHNNFCADNSAKPLKIFSPQTENHLTCHDTEKYDPLIHIQLPTSSLPINGSKIILQYVPDQDPSKANLPKSTVM